MKQTPTLRLGIDPGLSGAIALLKDNELVWVEDMPVMAKGSGNKQQVNVAELGKILSPHRDTGVTAYLELVHDMPGQGSSSTFSFGVSYGDVRAVIITLGIPLIYVSPQKWKKAAGLIRKDKDYARTLAQQLYPAAPLGRKKDIGRAESILIARFSC